MPTVESLIGRSILKLRTMRGLSQSELAERAGMHIRSVQDLEWGKRPDPRLSSLLALAGALAVEPSRLLAPLDAAVRKLLLDEESEMKQIKTSSSTDPQARTREKIRRKEQLARKWRESAEEQVGDDPVSRACRRYCEGLARWQDEERERLVRELVGG